MRAGKLKHRITIKAPVETQSGTGAPTIVWNEFASVWASIEPLEGKEFFTAQQLYGEVTSRIVMRYKAGITRKMRVEFGTRVFDIIAVLNPEEKNRELKLLVKEVV